VEVCNHVDIFFEFHKSDEFLDQLNMYQETVCVMELVTCVNATQSGRTFNSTAAAGSCKQNI
jgi:hypothetical protein